MNWTVDLTRRAYGVIAPRGGEAKVRGGRQAEAWVSVVICAVWVSLNVWLVSQALSWALSAADAWLAVFAWIGVGIALLIGLFSLGLLVIVAVGSDLFGRRERPEATDTSMSDGGPSLAAGLSH